MPYFLELSRDYWVNNTVQPIKLKFSEELLRFGGPEVENLIHQSFQKEVDDLRKKTHGDLFVPEDNKKNHLIWPELFELKGQMASIQAQIDALFNHAQVRVKS